MYRRITVGVQFDADDVPVGFLVGGRADAGADRDGETADDGHGDRERSSHRPLVCDPVAKRFRLVTATALLRTSNAVDGMLPDRASMDVEDLLKIILVLIIVWIAIQILFEIIGGISSIFGSFFGVLIVVLIVAYFLDYI
jgi:hypothetical protein